MADLWLIHLTLEDVEDRGVISLNQSAIISFIFPKRILTMASKLIIPGNGIMNKTQLLFHLLLASGSTRMLHDRIPWFFFTGK